MIKVNSVEYGDVYTKEIVVSLFGKRFFHAVAIPDVKKSWHIRRLTLKSNPPIYRWKQFNFVVGDFANIDLVCAKKSKY